MKHIFKSLFLIVGATIVFAACRKFDSLPYYANGTAPTLTASTNTVSSASSDSASTVLTLNWSNPHYAADSASQKFIIEIDSSGRGFAREYTKTVSGALSASFTAADLNAIVAAFAFKPDSTYTLDMRVKSSYANNNEQYSSNVVAVTITPYIVPVTLTPSSTNALTLSISNAGSQALTFSWTASAFGTSTIYYALQIDTSSSFTKPQVIQYGSTALSSSLSVGDLNTALINLGVAAGATATASFRIVGYLDAAYMQPSVFSNTAAVSVQTYLPFLYEYVPGDYQGWNPPSAPSIASTIPDLNAYEGYVYVPAGGSYQFKITSDPDWNHTNYGGTTSMLSTSGDNLMWPNGAGYYLLKVDMSSLAWSAAITNWGIIGAATPKGWDASTPLTYDVTNNVWTVMLQLTAGDLKFRANDAWDINLGGNLNALSYNGSNITIADAGTYKVVLDLSHPRKYAVTFTKQ